MTEAQKISFEYFVKNAEDLEKKYNGKFIAIKNCVVVGEYNTFADAVRESIKKGYNDSDFIVQEVNKDHNSYTAAYLNKGFFKVV